MEDLHDVNTIASLLKSWLRDLPDEIMPKAMQEDVVRKYGRSPQAPPELKEIISTLPPWNYYLLFAITCHLSLVCGYAEINQMSPSNLYTCIGTSLKMDGTVFRWLVEDWRNCWKGCATEKQHLQREYEIIDGHIKDYYIENGLGEVPEDMIQADCNRSSQETQQAYPTEEGSSSRAADPRLPSVSLLPPLTSIFHG